MAASKFAPDGILGLAFPSYSKFIGGSGPLFHTLYNEGKLSEPVFSLKLTDSGGELYVGGTNKDLYFYNTLVYVPVTNPVSVNARLHGCILRFPFQVLWELKIDYIQVNGHIVLTDVAAVIDTGAHFIIGDEPRALALHDAGRGGAYTGNLRGRGYYTCEL
jgi:Eukaryotic aspartyl protease